MTARWGFSGLMPDDDACGMPVGHGQTCPLPGDHGGACHTPAVKCLCSHVRHDGQCFSLSCGCREFRPQEIAS